MVENRLGGFGSLQRAALDLRPQPFDVVSAHLRYFSMSCSCWYSGRVCSYLADHHIGDTLRVDPLHD
jgi:hypothetical protein